MSTLDEDTKQGPKPLAIIPARKGSRRLKNKNKLLLNGKPLVAYTIEAAVDSKVFNMIVVSSDDMDILEIAFDYFDSGIIQPHKRPKGLAGAKTKLKEVVRFILATYGAGEVFCILQPTCPQRTAEDIKRAYRAFQFANVDYLVSTDFNDRDNGAFTFAKTRAFAKEYPETCVGKNWIPYYLDVVDIDTEADFKWVGALMG